MIINNPFLPNRRRHYSLVLVSHYASSTTEVYKFPVKTRQRYIYFNFANSTKNHTMKNFSQSFSKGNELGVKNMKAIFGFFD